MARLADTECRLDRIMAHAVPQGRASGRLRRRIGRCREHLSVFLADREVPATNNVSERALWRHGTKEALAARFAAIRVRMGDGPVLGNNRHLPGKEAWLVGEWRTGGERKYTLSNLGPRTSLRALAAAIKARWVCEQGHQQMKGDLGLGHFEGRSWTGLHRHALMTCIAHAYLQHLRLAGHRRTGRRKNADPSVGSAPAIQPACLPCAAPSQPGCSSTS